MTHQELANGFKQFTYESIINEAALKVLLPSLNNDEIFRRIIINRLYYALYHKYLQEDVTMRELSGPGQHNAIIKKLEKHGDANLYRVYSKLYALRVWADYKLEVDPNALSLNLQTLNFQVHGILERSTFGI